MPSDNIYAIADYLEKLLNVSMYSHGDILCNGIQIEGTRPISTIATAVTSSLFAIEQAQSLNADLLITHHGLFLKNGLLPIQGILRKRVACILAAGIHLLSYHLPLDSHEEYGNAWPAAKALGWENLKGFGEFQGKKIGVCGSLKKENATGDLFETLRKYWGVGGVCLGAERSIKTVAFISGSGHRFIQEALSMNIDCFITGTVDDSTWHIVRESNITVMAFGHYATERLGVQLLGTHLSDIFGLRHVFIDEHNPF